jgi:GNAT superfamily N-acetyltransferase
MITVVEVAWEDPAAVTLREAMAAEMTGVYADRLSRDGLPVGFAVSGQTAAYTGLATLDGAVAGHLALRWVGPDLELKRLYVTTAARGHGVARALLQEAETVAWARGATRLVLQTGDRQPDAVRLYEKAGYEPIPVFPPHDRISFSLCFAKRIGR